MGLGNVSCRFFQNTQSELTPLWGRTSSPCKSHNFGILSTFSPPLGAHRALPFHWGSTNSLPCFAGGSFSLPQSSAKLLLIFWQLLWFQIKSLLISFRSSDSTFLLLLTHSFWQRSTLCQFAICCFSSLHGVTSLKRLFFHCTSETCFSSSPVSCRIFCPLISKLTSRCSLCAPRGKTNWGVLWKCCSFFVPLRHREKKKKNLLSVFLKTNKQTKNHLNSLKMYIVKKKNKCKDSYGTTATIGCVLRLQLPAGENCVFIYSD